MNTHRLTTLQALTIADKGGQEHRDTDRGDTLAPVARSCWLSLSRSMMMHHKGNEHSQGHRNTDRLTPLQALAIADTGGQGHRRATPSLSYRGLQKNYFNILIGKYFNRKIFLQGHTDRRDTDTGDRLAPVGSRSLAL